MLNGAIEFIPDERVADYPILNNNFDIFLCAFIYLLCVYAVIPYFMRNRPAFKLKTTICCYNVFQILINCWIIFQFIKSGWSYYYHYSCISNDSNSDLVFRAFFLLLLIKFLDFLDTVFFLLRKKNNQVTNLHVVHHVLAPIMIWCAARFSHNMIYSFESPFILNCFVHVFMYFYYLLAGLGFKNLVVWKKAMTTFQLLQFMLNFMNGALLIKNCEMKSVSKFLTLVFAIPFNFILSVLFINFYVQSYLKRKIK